MKSAKLLKTWVVVKLDLFNIDFFSSFICQHFNYCIGESKHADIIPVHKKG